MKISLALGKRQPLSRQTAWGCLTANLALPGSGSLVGGYVSGYPQLALCVIGLGLTTVFGLRFIYWYFANWSRVMAPDPVSALGQMWVEVKWPLLGMLIFLVALLWSLVTSLAILRSAQKIEPPPRIVSPPAPPVL
jgi:hypothetical protein